jgi:HlyD family secretion protein
MKKGCLIAAAIVFVIASIGLGYYFYKQSKKDPDVYQTENPVITDIVKKTVATGSINPRKEVQIKPQVSGVIDRIFVEEGQIVQKGQELARIKLIPSEVNVNTAQSNVELSRIRYQEAQRELKRQQEIFNKNLDIESARASFDNATREEERQRKLFEEGIISEQDYNLYNLELDLRKAEYENAKIAATSDIRQLEADVDIRKQELDAAQNNLQLLKEGVTKNSRQVSNIVVSTLEGMVLDLPVEEGSSVIERNNFNEGTSIAVVADMNSLIFEGTVDEADVGKLKEGMPLELTVGAIESARFDAVLEHISPKGQEEEGSVKFEVRAAITSSEDVFLRAGYSANGDIILERKEQVVAINEGNLIFEGDTCFVEIATGDQQYERRKITTGTSDGIMIEVTSGLDTADQVKVLKL